MVVSLLELGTGHVSLEFEPADFPAVLAAIRSQFGEPDRVSHPTYASVTFGGCTFIYQDEWDDPCLISSNDQGDKIVNRLFASLRQGVEGSANLP